MRIEMKISTFNNIKTTMPNTIQGDISFMARGLLTPILDRAKAKEEIPLWSPTTFQGTRNGKNAIEVSCLVYDIDDGLTNINTWRCFNRYSLMAHTSFSHRPEHPKYRIILPLAKPIPARDWDRACIAAEDMWDALVGIGKPDMKALKDVARVYFRYALPDNDYRDYQEDISHHGELLTLDYSYVEIETKQVRRVEYNPAKPMKLEDIELTEAFRTHLAHQINGKIVGNTARYIMCPQCGDRSVYFSLDLTSPTSIKWPQCNHQNTCRWWGSLKDLL
jgi:hypothetical protein